MNELYLYVLALPVIFMFHDFEEMLFLPGWKKSGLKELERRFPKMKALFENQRNISSVKFNMMVAEEFFIISVVTFFSVLSGSYYLWLIFFLGFSIHIFIHIAQWIVARIYIPAIVTSILVLPYCIFAFLKVVEVLEFTSFEYVLAAVIGIAFTAANLFVMHRLVAGIRI